MGLFERGYNPWDDVIVRRTARARRLSLRVSRLDGRVTLTLPPGASDREARRFVSSKADWIARAQAEAVEAVFLEIGATLPIEGVPRLIKAGHGKSPQLEGDVLRVPEKGTAPALRAWVIERARARARLMVDRYGNVLGHRMTRLTMRDPRSRWGSCSSAGGIMLSWRLILAPEDIFDYVVAHEVAHLAEMNHGPAFWATVERLMPDYDAPRLWLRREGASLHRYRFD